MRLIDRFIGGVDAHPVPALLAAVATLALTAGVVVSARQAVKLVRRHELTVEQIGTVVAAAIATGVSAQGMWVFFEESLHLTLSLRIMFFAFLEIMVITSALRARAAQRHGGSAGVDGIAMWVLTCLSAVLAATDADNLGTLLIRLSAPLVAAWGWERSMALERRRAGQLTRINWRLTPERILIRLGLADPTDRTASEVATQRRLIEVALAHDRARSLRDSHAGTWRTRRAMSRLQKAMRAAVEEGGLVTAPRQREVLLDMIGVLSSTSTLVDMELPNPWLPVPPDNRPRPDPATTDPAETTGVDPYPTAPLGVPPSDAVAASAVNGPTTAGIATGTAIVSAGNGISAGSAGTGTPVGSTRTGTAIASAGNGKAAVAKPRRRDPTVRRRVRELHEANTPPAEISSQLDISRRTVGRIIGDLEEERRSRIPGMLGEAVRQDRPEQKVSSNGSH
ncbi:hypothetical protein [Nocardia pseudobrasiliensis]|uniref:Homeodomain-like domain-containing protein n=1 Tax=Nocardia pseudobrasiliensis TaxID=45979 RepID=A0A370I396_9NOCA|nr:hypothetical protein [Nocardia pseudobrasiliensis]RDI65222.1 hypothetical protein DFR76_10691 [Nocardia pseudobrasiliensis]